MVKRVLGMLVLGTAFAAACAPRSHYGHHHEMTDHDAWEIVQHDPCRYDEYRRFAAEHENPDKRREEVWRLAHEGCAAERQRQQDAPGYYRDYR